MKAIKILKWTGMTLAALVLLTLSFIYGRSYYIFNKTYDIPLTEITVPTDSASIAEGLRQVRLLHCNGCHGEHLEGKIMHEDDKFGRIVSANITQKIREYTDPELYRVIRHGIRKDGKIAFVMPARSQYHLTDESVANIIAYLRTLEVQQHEPPLPEMDLKIMARTFLAFKIFEPEQMAMDHQAPRVSADFENNPLVHGEYLTTTICSHCHGENLEGSEMMQAPGLNIIFLYDREKFHHFLKTGEAATRKDAGEMSKMAREHFKYFTTEEVDAVYTYLKARLEDDVETVQAGLD